MTTIQIIALIIGGLFLIPDSFWSNLKPITKPDVKKVEEPKVELSSIVELVTDWREFRKRVEAKGLSEIVTRMDEIFPLLLKVEQEESK